MFKKILVSFLVFYHLYTEMLFAGCGSRWCRTKNNTAEQILAKFLKFLCCLVNYAHDGQFYACCPILHAQYRRIPTSLNTNPVGCIWSLAEGYGNRDHGTMRLGKACETY